MNEKKNFVLAKRPSSAVEKAAPGVRRVLSGMVADALALAKRKQHKLAKAKLRIGNYEWCEPDYRQILLWAKSLSLEPEEVIKRLIDGEKEFVYENFREGTCFDSGRLRKINWNFDLLRMQDFEWVEGLETTHVLFENGSSHEPLYKKTLDLPLPELTHLACSNLGVNHINLFRTPKLHELWCVSNELTELDLLATPNLTVLHCRYNFLSELNLANIRNLVELDCSNNRGIKELDLLNVPNLMRLSCGHICYGHGETIAELNLSRVPRMEYLNCWYNKLPRLELSGVPDLLELRCSNNEITELDLSKVPRLEKLSCFGNRIKVLDIRPLLNLEELSYIDKSETNRTETRLIQRPDQNF